MFDRLLASSLLILAIVFIRFLLRDRISARLRYALWLPVLVVLLLPFHPVESGFSLRNLVDRIPTVQHIGLLEDFSHIELSEDGVVSGMERYVIMPDYLAFVTEGVSEQEFLAMKRFLDLRPYLDLIRHSGILLLAFAFIGMNISFRKKLELDRESLACGESPIPVYVSSGLSSPCLFGLFSPSVYLTPETAAEPELKGYALLHELAHWRHKDHIWSFLRTVTLVLFWYDPFVWLAVILSRRDGELAADESAIKDMEPMDRLEYGRSLIGLTVRTVDRSLFVNGTAMLGGEKILFRRVRRIAEAPKPKKYAAFLGVLLLIFAVLLTCTAAAAAPAEFYQWKNELGASDITYAQASCGFGIEQVAYVLEREDIGVLTEAIRSVPDSSVSLSAGYMHCDHTLIMVDGKDNEILLHSDGERIWLIFGEGLAKQMDGYNGYWQLEDKALAQYVIRLSEVNGTPVTEMK